MLSLQYFQHSSYDKEEIIAVYDLNNEAITFDFAHFIASAEAYAIKKNKGFVVWIIERDNSQHETYELYDDVVDDDDKQWRFKNIILPLVGLYPACSGFSVFPNKMAIKGSLKGKWVYPEGYDAKNYLPRMTYDKVMKLLESGAFTGFRADKQGLRYIKLWLKENDCTRKTVTITIRQYGYDESRNSNINEWIKFADWLILAGYSPIFVLDTGISFIKDKRFDGYTVFNEISWNLNLRMALYEEAFVNFVSAGPGTIAQLNKKVRYINMEMYSEGSLEASLEVFEEYGLELGQRRYPFAGQYQLISWKEGIFENILSEFNEFEKL